MFSLHRKAALLLTSLVITTTTTQLKAQGFYIKEGIGYGFAMPGETKDELGNILSGTQTNSGSSTSYQLKAASFSSGLHNTLGAGYMFTKNIGVELNADILLAAQKNTFNDIGVTVNSTPANVTYTRQASHSVTIMPALVLQTGGTKVNAYMRMGIALPVYSAIDRHDIYQFQGGRIEDDHWKVSNYFLPGFTGATGIKYNVSPVVTLWGEVSFLYMALSRKESDIVDVTINGTTYSAGQLTGTKTYTYSKNATVVSGGSEFQTFSQPYSNIGIMVGISFNFRRYHKVIKSKKSEVMSRDF